MEKTKNKDIFKNLCVLFAKGDGHSKGDQKTQQKPNERKLKTYLTEQIES